VRIAQVASCHESTPPNGYGSINRIVSDLAESLVAAGHEVTLFATGDSRTAAMLRWTFPFPLAGELNVGREWLHSIRSLQRCDGFDIVHNHNFFSGSALSFLPRCGAFVTTAHVMPGDAWEFVDHLLWQPLIVLSEAQRRSLRRLRPMAVIRPGLRLEDYPYQESKQDYILFLGRVGRPKGVDTAIAVATLAGRPLVIAGPVPPWERAYFEECILPAVDGERVRYVGEVGGDERAGLLSSAHCLIMPSTVEETFGLVLIEAMACGTPVIGSPWGAIPEVIDDGHTGFVASSPQEMAEAVIRCASIVPSECRRQVDQHFGINRMVDEHVALYERLLS